jgi:hypothetical protein
MMRSIVRVAAVGALGLSTACVTATPHQIQLPQTAVRPVARIDAVLTDAVALATMAAVVEREFGLPPLPVTYHFYPSRSAFEAMLVQVGHDPGFAREASGTLRAIAGFGHVLLNEQRLSLRWPDRLFTFTHEYTHCLQYALAAGARGTSVQWLREGFADAVAARVLDRLGAVPLDAARRQRREQLDQTDRARAPELGSLLTFTDWIAATARPEIAPDAQAFLAADALIERHGVAAMLDYFAAFAVSDDRAANFRAAFGRDVTAFERELDRTLGIVRGS